MNTFALTYLLATQQSASDLPQLPVTDVIAILNNVMQGKGGEKEWRELKGRTGDVSYIAQQALYFVRYRPSVRASLLEKSHWKYPSHVDQAKFQSAFLSAIKPPFKDFKITSQKLKNQKDGDVVREHVRIEETIDGLFTGCNNLTFTIDYRTGEFESIQFIGGWKPRREPDAIDIGKVEKAILYDGKYDSKTTNERWVPISWTEKEPSGAI